MITGDRSKQFLREFFEDMHGAYKNFFNDIWNRFFMTHCPETVLTSITGIITLNVRFGFLNGGLFYVIWEL